MQCIERDNSNFKLEKHTVSNRMQYKNRTIKKQYKIPNIINNNRYPKKMNIIDAIKNVI